MGSLNAATAGNHTVARAEAVTLPLQSKQPRTISQLVRDAAMTGGFIGAGIGIVLKLIDTSMVLAAGDHKEYILILVAGLVVGYCLLANLANWSRGQKGGCVGLMLYGLYFIWRGGYNPLPPLVMGVCVLFAGSILGFLPGMAVGGAVGLTRRHAWPWSKSSPREAAQLVWTAFVLPFVGGIGLLALYVGVINPWLIKFISQ